MTFPTPLSENVFGEAPGGFYSERYQLTVFESFLLLRTQCLAQFATLRIKFRLAVCKMNLMKNDLSGYAADTVHFDTPLKN